MQYKKVRDITTKEAESCGVNHYRVNYDDFVKEPEKVLNQLLDHLGLNPSVEINRYMKKNKIYNRNSKASEYFNKEEQEKIMEILSK